MNPRSDSSQSVSLEANSMICKKLIDVKNHSQAGFCVESHLGFITNAGSPEVSSKC